MTFISGEQGRASEIFKDQGKMLVSLDMKGKYFIELAFGKN